MKENLWFCKILAIGVNVIDNFGYFYLFLASFALMVELASISWMKILVAIATSWIVAIIWAVTMQFTSNATCWISAIEQPQNLINHGLQFMLLVLTLTILLGSIFLPGSGIERKKIR